MFCDKKVTAIITAAGKGSRMKASLPKQFLELHGRSVLERAVEPFQNSCYVDDILVVSDKDFEELCKNICCKFSKVKEVVTGGNERQDSVNNGLKHVHEGYVLIHDGARPYVTEEVINNVIFDTEKFGAAVPCVPVKETVRQLRGKNFAEVKSADSKTLDRNSLHTVQTPQALRPRL